MAGCSIPRLSPDQSVDPLHQRNAIHCRMLVGMPQPDGFVVQGAAGGSHTDRLHMGNDPGFTHETHSFLIPGENRPRPLGHRPKNRDFAGRVFFGAGPSIGLKSFMREPWLAEEATQ
jgi:hypothetical protein